DCRWIVYGGPVLVHPVSGVIFGFASGARSYTLRLPHAERLAALRAGARRIEHYRAYPSLGIPAGTLDLDQFGPEWVFGGWLAGEDNWCLAAYELAGSEGEAPGSDAGKPGEEGRPV